MTAPVLQIPVKFLRSAVAGRRPGDGNFRALTDGDFFVNTYDKVACYLDASGTMVTMPFDTTKLAPLASPAFTGTPTAPTTAAGNNSTSLATTAYADRAAGNIVGSTTPAMDGAASAGSAATAARSDHVHPIDTSRAPLAAQPSRCILTTSGTSGTSSAALLLLPLAGNGVLVNGAIVTIPDAGISLAPTSLTASTFYYVYLTSAAALEASTTAPVVQAGTGLRIKGGASGATDPTRRLVGMALVGSNGYFYNSPVYRYVRSYFNDPGIAGLAATTANQSQTSNSSSVQANVIALMWNGENANLTASARASSNVTNGSVNLQAGVSGNGIGPLVSGQAYGGGANFGLASAATYTATSDAAVVFQLLFSSDGSSTATLNSGAEISVTTSGNGVR